MKSKALWLLIVACFVGPLAAEEPAPEFANTLKWRTASEVENFGFDVYRGDAEEGPFEKLTASPIPGAGTVDEPREYRYVDATIDPRRAYWYFVESIAFDGTRERFTPVFRAKPKLESERDGEQPAAEPPPEGGDSEPAPG